MNLLAVLLLGDLGSALLVLVGSHDLALQSFELVRGGADALNLFLLASVDNFEVSHFAGEGILDLALLVGLEMRITECCSCHNGLLF